MGKNYSSQAHFPCCNVIICGAADFSAVNHYVTAGINEITNEWSTERKKTIAITINGRLKQLESTVERSPATKLLLLL